MLFVKKIIRWPILTQYLHSRFFKTWTPEAFRLHKCIIPTVTRRSICCTSNMNSLKKDKTGKKTLGHSEGKEKITRSFASEVEKRDREHYLKLPLDEKRKCYKCGSKYVLLDDVPCWPDYADSLKGKVRKSTKALHAVDEILNMKISLWRGDITRLEIDAIVNAANSTLLGGGGVDGSIHRAAGKSLVAECSRLNGCPTGEAKLTGGYKLPAKYVIHTVGPIGEQPDMLTKCYKNSLDLAKENNIRTIAFPCISTGIYGYDVGKATPVVMQTVRNWLQVEDNSKCIDKVIFCVFLINDVAVYESNLLQYFPVDKSYVQDILPDRKRSKKSSEVGTEAKDGETKEQMEVDEKSKGELKQTVEKKLKDSDKEVQEPKRMETSSDHSTKL